MKDSGKRTHFETGAEREILDEKGRCDLIYNKAWGELINNDIYTKIEEFVRTGNVQLIYDVLHKFIKCNCVDYESAYLDLAKHYAEGAKKYSDRNMEKGLPFHSMIDSALRHYTKFLRGDLDECHDRAFLWNLITLLYMIDNHPELNDLPYKEEMK